MITRIKVIAFAGQIGTGKSLCADYLCATHGYVRVKMADPLKNMLRAIGLTTAHIEGSLKEEPCDLLEGKTPRWAMQSLGVEWGREQIGQQFWANTWVKEVERHLTLGTPVVADDLRYINEAQAVKAMGGVTVHLKRGELKDVTHSSELIDFKCDHTLNNNEEEAIGLMGMLDRIVNFDLFKSYQMEHPPEFFGDDPFEEEDVTDPDSRRLSLLGLDN